MVVVNVWNEKTITQFLIEISNGDEALARLLDTALHRALLKHTDCLRPVETLPADAPDWMRKKWPGGGPYAEFVPDTRLRGQVQHVADWIKAALVNEERWLTNVDDKGRPLRLVKIGSLQTALGKADRAMSRGGPSVEEAETDTRTVMQLDNGFRIVQLLTPQALDVETGMLGHCIGNGAYDTKLNSRKRIYYSLRDPQNKAHVTFEVDASGDLIQCRGKQDKSPVAKYMPYVRAFIEKEQFTLLEQARHTGLVKVSGMYYDILHLPRNLKIPGDLYLRDAPITSLPEGLEVGGDLYLSDTPISSLPEGLSVGGSLELSGTPISSLPEGLKVGYSLGLSNTPFTSLPEGLKVAGHLGLSNTPLTSLPAGLKVGGGLVLIGTPIRSLPEGLKVGGDLDLRATPISSLPEGLKIGGNLYLQGTPIRSLPAGLEVGGSIDLSGTRVTSLPEGLKVGATLYLSDTPIRSLPEGLDVGGDLDLSGTPLTSLPRGLKVGGSLDLRGTPISSWPEGLKVGGRIIGWMRKSWEKTEKDRGSRSSADRGI